MQTRARRRAAQAVCAVCLESGVTLVTLDACRHTACPSCWKQWIGQQTGQLRARLRCIDPTCSCRASVSDVRRLAPEHINAYRRNLLLLMPATSGASTATSGASTATHDLPASVRPCPACSVPVTRDTGCSSVQCICGQRFCFDCGLAQCTAECRGRRLRLLVQQQAMLWNQLHP
jgi:hypothetical protein